MPASTPPLPVTPADNRLRLLLDNAQESLVLFQIVWQPATGEADFRYVLANQTTEHLLGIPTDQLLGRLMTEVDTTVRQSSLWPLCQRLAQTGESFTSEQPYGRNGQEGWYQVVGRRDDDYLVLSTLDITIRKRDEQEQARQQADLMQAMLQSTMAGMTLYQAVRDEAGQIVDFRYVFTNPVNARNTGRSVDELTGGRLLEFFPGVRDTDYFRNLLRVIETGEPVRFLFPYYADGIEGWYDISFVKQGDGVLFTDLDVTESQMARRQLERANQDLLRSNDSLRQFAYVASHDLQEPLRKIQAFGSMLLDRYAAPLGDEGTLFLQRMQTAAGRMSALIRDLLDYSRLTNQWQPTRRLSLRAVLDTVLSDLDLTMAEANARVEVGDLPDLPGDEPQLNRLFQNLLTNALKFRRPNVPPVIRIAGRPVPAAQRPDRLDDAGPPETGVDSRRPYWEISVADNGIGFEKHHAQRIFDVFNRLHTKNQYPGTGIGLAICKRVAENHGGTITADGQPGEGATFRVYLPA